MFKGTTLTLRWLLASDLFLTHLDVLQIAFATICRWIRFILVAGRARAIVLVPIASPVVGGATLSGRSYCRSWNPRVNSTSSTIVTVPLQVAIITACVSTVTREGQRLVRRPYRLICSFDYALASVLPFLCKRSLQVTSNKLISADVVMIGD